MADCIVNKLVGVLCDFLVMIGSFIFSTNFVILDCEIDIEVPIMLGRPFLATRCSLVGMKIR